MESTSLYLVAVCFVIYGLPFHVFCPFYYQVVCLFLFSSYLCVILPDPNLMPVACVTSSFLQITGFLILTKFLPLFGIFLNLQPFLTPSFL